MSEDPKPVCALCGQELTEKEAEVCRQSPERFDGQMLCEGHQRRFSACPAIRS